MATHVWFVMISAIMRAQIVNCHHEQGVTMGRGGGLKTGGLVYELKK